MRTKDLLNAIEVVLATMILVASLSGIIEHHRDQVSKRLEVPTWPPNDSKPATADARP